MKDARKAFARRLRALIRVRKENRSQVAALLNVAASTVTKYCNGRVPGDPNSLVKLADHFFVTTDYLLGRVDVDGVPVVNEERAQYQVITKAPSVSTTEFKEMVKLFREKGPSLRRPEMRAIRVLLEGDSEE